MDFADYRLEQDGLVLCEPCLTFSFFSDAQLDSTEPPDILAPYRAFVEAFGAQVSYCRTSGGQMHAKKITQTDLDMPYKWLSDSKKRSRGQLDIELRTGSCRDEWRAPCLEIVHRKQTIQHTCYRICISLDCFMQWKSSGVIQYLEQSLTAFPLMSGYVGLSFAWNYARPPVEDLTKPYFYRWLQRHPGIMCPEILSQNRVSHCGLVDLGWITLLGSAYCERMGHIEGLRAALAPCEGVVVEPLGASGAAIRIGEAPRLGDVLAGDTMEDYRAVGQALAPLCLDRHVLHEEMVIHGLYDKNSDKIQSQWIDRFFPT